MTRSGAGYPTPSRGDWAVRRIDELKTQIRELSRPTGSQTNNLSEYVIEILNDLTADILNPPESVTINGDVIANTGIFESGVTSAGARINNVTNNYAAAYIDGNGDFGINVSTVREKTNIDTVSLKPEIEALYTIALVTFQYERAVREQGELAPVEVGTIAEYAEQAGLGRWIMYNENGEILGINYERLTIPLIATVQDLNSRLRAIEEKLAASDATESPSAPSE